MADTPARRGRPASRRPAATTKAGRPAPPLYATLLGLHTGDPIEVVERVRQGFEFEALERFQRNTNLSTSEVADLVSIKARTLHRRREQGRLDPEESDRLVRVSRVFARAIELFEGDAAGARQWFQAPAPALRGRPPIALAGTDVGAREVEALIDRLEHGVLV